MIRILFFKGRAVFFSKFREWYLNIVRILKTHTYPKQSEITFIFPNFPPNTGKNEQIVVWAVEMEVGWERPQCGLGSRCGGARRLPRPPAGMGHNCIP